MNEHRDLHKNYFEEGVDYNLQWQEHHPDMPQPRFRYLIWFDHENPLFCANREEALNHVASHRDSSRPVTEVYDLTHRMDLQIDVEGVWNL